MDTSPPIPSFWWKAGTETPAEETADPSLRELQEEHRAALVLLQAQDPGTRAWLEREAGRIAESLMADRKEIRIDLPAGMRVPAQEETPGETLAIPDAFRAQSIRRGNSAASSGGLRSEIRRRLLQLEHSPYAGLAVAGRLIRLATAQELVRAALRKSADRPDETILRIVSDAGGDGIPITEAALQRVATALARGRQAAFTLYLALALAPYIFTDAGYQSARQNVLGRTLDLGWALGSRYADLVMRKIDARAAARSLDRGLRLSLPYFDEPSLDIRLHEFDVIPGGHIAFVPAFVALAALREQERVERDPAFTPATRMHLLAELKRLERHYQPAQP